MKKISEDNKLVIILFLVGLSLVFFKNFIKNYEINSNKKKTVGKIIRYRSGGKGSTFFDYKYLIDKQEYEESIQAGNKGKEYENRFFIIEYSSRKPKVSRVLFDKEIKDTTLIRNYGFKFNEQKYKYFP